MDPGSVGAIIGAAVILGIGISLYAFDRCCYKPNDEYVHAFNPLLQKKRSFKVKNLFNHVQI